MKLLLGKKWTVQRPRRGPTKASGAAVRGLSLTQRAIKNSRKNSFFLGQFGQDKYNNFAYNELRKVSTFFGELQSNVLLHRT